MNTTDLFLEKIETAIRAYRNTWNTQSPVNLYEPVAYSLHAGGKRLRPLLVLLGYSLFDDDVDKAIPAALAIEVFHNFTLLHDDIMDKAEKRRGLPTVHHKFSDNAAILSGDAMAFLAYQLLLQTRTEHMHDLTTLFTDTALQVCEGQQHDMDFETRMDVTTPEYVGMIRLKTAVLLGCALKTGAIAGNAPDDEAMKVYQVGIDLGMAFQLQDDLLDTFGNEREFGKSIGGDIVANKKTFLLIEALTTANEEQKTELLKWLNRQDFDRQEKIDAVKRIYDELQIKEKTEKVILEYIENALSLLKALSVDKPGIIHLEELCRRLITRDS